MATNWVTRGLVSVGVLELTIGLSTVGHVVVLRVLQGSAPSGPGYLLAAMAFVSCGLGIGIIRTRPMARRWLIGFSTLIVVNKVLAWAGGPAVTSGMSFLVPESAKDLVSCAYHLAVIVFLSQPQVEERFQR